MAEGDISSVSTKTVSCSRSLQSRCVDYYLKSSFCGGRVTAASMARGDFSDTEQRTQGGQQELWLSVLSGSQPTALSVFV